MSGALLAALVIGMLGMPEADAHGKGGHSGGHSGGGGHAPRPPRVSAPRQNYRAPAMARAAAPARANNTRSQAMARSTQGRTHNNTQAHANNTQTHTNNARVHTNTAQAHTVNGQANTNHTAAVSTRSSILGTTSPTTTSTGTTGTGTGNTFFPNTGTRTGNTFFPNTYSYGTGAGARAYRAYGYGRGYRNSYYGNRYGYGRSQSNNRAIISRLRSVHSSLARVDHDYQGHRVRSMHAISMAVRQLSNRSMVYNNTGFGAGMNNGQAMGMQGGLGRGMRQGGGFGGGVGRQGQPMSQAQSDSRMSQNLRTLQGINMQLTNQGYNTTGHARARGHVQQAIHELNVALSVR
jgi:hypothetical protein